MITLIESPFAGNIPLHHAYWKLCVRDSIARGETPFSSHFYYTQVLDDTIPTERKQGIELGYALWSSCQQLAFYMDFGLSTGMRFALQKAEDEGFPYVSRFLGCVEKLQAEFGGPL